MDRKTFHIITFGCQMNERDSETMAGMLEAKGYVRNADPKTSDVILINTCSVRENADKKFFGTLGLIKKYRENRPGTVVGVCGCMMQQQHIIDTIRAKYNWVDLVFGTMNIHRLPELLDNLTNESKKQREIWDEHHGIVEGLPADRTDAFKAYVNIMYGCNNFCTYCIVPYTRGRERSRAPKDILREVKGLVANGTKEITLLGQNVNSYRGVDDTPGCAESGLLVSFPDLIYDLQEIEGLERIRFMTSHPKDLSPALIRAYKDCPKLMPHIHLPVQSGNTEVLRRMNRHYTREEYIALTEALREAVPGIAVTTDIIVGFPGETEEQFSDTLSLVETVRFDSAFTFIYSVRKGTPAAEWPDQIPEDVKHERFNRLVDVCNAISAEKNAALTGRTLPILCEGESKSDPGLFTGRTPGHKLVNFTAGRAPAAGETVPVRITSSNTFSLLGEAD